VNYVMLIKLVAVLIGNAFVRGVCHCIENVWGA